MSKRALSYARSRALQKASLFLDQNKVNQIFDIHLHNYSREHLVSDTQQPITIRTIEPKKPHTATFLSYTLNRNNQIIRLILGKHKKYRAALFGLPIPHFDFEKANEYVISNSLRQPNLTPFAIVRPTATEAELEKLIERGFHGFKPYPEAARVKGKPKNLKLEQYLTPEVLTVANRYGLPIMLHLHNVPRPGSELFKDLILAVKRHPQAKFILAHMAQIREVEDASLLLWFQKLKNVFLETSTITNPKIFEKAIDYLGHRRILYGSDLPFALLRARYVNKADLRKIFGTNLEGDGIFLCAQNYPWQSKNVLNNLPHSEKNKLIEIGIVQLNAMIDAIKKQKLTSKQIRDIFYNNAYNLLRK